MAAVWGAVISALASAALSSAASASQQKKQNALAEQLAAFRKTKSDEQMGATNKFLDTQRPEARAAANSRAETELARGLNTSIGTAQAFERPQNFSGKVSDDYTERVASNEASLGQRLKQLVSNLSVIGAPTRRDFDTSLKYGDAAGVVSGANSAVNNVGGRYMEGIGNVRPDPYLSFASQLAAGYGKAIAGKRTAEPTVTGISAYDIDRH